MNQTNSRSFSILPLGSYIRSKDPAKIAKDAQAFFSSDMGIVFFEYDCLLVGVFTSGTGKGMFNSYFSKHDHYLLKHDQTGATIAYNAKVVGYCDVVDGKMANLQDANCANLVLCLDISKINRLFTFK